MPKFSVFFEPAPGSIIEHTTEAKAWTNAVQQIAEREGYNTLAYRSCCPHISPTDRLWNGATLSRYEADAYNSISRTIAQYKAHGRPAPAHLYDEAHRVIANARKITAA